MGKPVITDHALGSCFSYIKRNDSTCQNDARKKNDDNTGAQIVRFNTGYFCTACHPKVLSNVVCISRDLVGHPMAVRCVSFFIFPPRVIVPSCYQVEL